MPIDVGCAVPPIVTRIIPHAAKIHVDGGEQPRLLSVVSGQIAELGDGKPAARQVLACGENVLLPYGKAFTFTATTTAIVLVTEDFA